LGKTRVVDFFPLAEALFQQAQRAPQQLTQQHEQ
jgi:hypothetical protein